MGANSDSDILGPGERWARSFDFYLFVSYCCWGSIFLIPGLKTTVVDKIDRDDFGYRVCILGGRRWREDAGN